LDVDRTPPLIDAADPPDQGHETPEDEAGWAALADRYREMPGREFIRLPEAERRAAVQARQQP
jgi:hypothetical protein